MAQYETIDTINLARELAEEDVRKDNLRTS